MKDDERTPERREREEARRATGAELDLTDDDEAALDRAWERIRKENEENPHLREDDDAFDAAHERMLERRRRS